MRTICFLSLLLNLITLVHITLLNASQRQSRSSMDVIVELITPVTISVPIVPICIIAYL